MKKVLEHVQSPEEGTWIGIKWALLLTCCDLLRIVFFNWTWNTNIRTALRLKSACTTLLYKKIIRLNSLGNKSTGEVRFRIYCQIEFNFIFMFILQFQITNLFTNDSQRLFDVVIYGPMIFSGPIIIICGIAYILWIFSPIAICGILTFLIFYPCQVNNVFFYKVCQVIFSIYSKFHYMTLFFNSILYPV